MKGWRRRPGQMPTTTAKLGLDTVALLRALMPALRLSDWTIDAVIWDLVRVLSSAGPSGIPPKILNGIPLDRSVYRSIARKTHPERFDE